MKGFLSGVRKMFCPREDETFFCCEFFSWEQTEASDEPRRVGRDD
jgi:hypothetical protein